MLWRVRHDWETFTPGGNFPSRIVICLAPSPRLMVPVLLSVFFLFLKIQIENEIQNVQGKFTQLRQILDSEEMQELRKLKDELGVILKELAESENGLVQKKLLVSNLISDVERHLQGSTMELLQVRLGKEPQHLRHERNMFLCPSDALAEVALTLQYTFSASISEVLRITELFHVGTTRQSSIFIVIKLIANISPSREDLLCSVIFHKPLFSVGQC